MEWTPRQQAAIDAVKEWFLHRTSEQQVFRLFGYAGTGKTTIAKACAQSVTENVLFGSFTGKAAHVLRQKGCGAARTIHSLIYQPKDKSSATLVELKEMYAKLLLETPLPAEKERHELKCRTLAAEIAKEQSGMKQPAFSLNHESDVKDCRLVVIDEVSMVGRKMGEDLLFFEKPVLVLGDPAQLPPVADGGYFTNEAPDVMLEEVHRQAEGSPVIAMATKVRSGGRLSLGDYGDSQVVRRGDIAIEEIALGFDQVLCGRNATRRGINGQIRRKVLGRESPFPVQGDRLVCLRNNHEMGLLNGSLWNVEEATELDEKQVGLTLTPQEGGPEVLTCAHKAPFLGLELDYFERREADEFDFGYALTVHKAQGSQWGSVYVVDESGAFREHARRWLYTALTRAADRVCVSV